MKFAKSSRFWWAGLAAGIACLPQSLWACATCYGKTDSRLAEGMNWGILSLLGVVSFVLISVAAFFVYHLVRSAKLAQAGANAPARSL